ncbi:MAG: hypothetical protein QG673_2318, partial [Pseudomonadota bacterium]|nr:hypothetical protein [Pseudomonadota bacterium]
MTTGSVNSTIVHEQKYIYKLHQSFTNELENNSQNKNLIFTALIKFISQLFDFDHHSAIQGSTFQPDVAFDPFEQEKTGIAVAIRFALPQLKNLLKFSTPHQILIHTNKDRGYQIFAVKTHDQKIEIRIAELEDSVSSQTTNLNGSMLMASIDNETLKKSNLETRLLSIQARCNCKILEKLQEEQVTLATLYYTNAEQHKQTHPELAAIEYEAAGNCFVNASADSQAKAAYNKAAQTISEVLTNSLNNKTCNFADNNISKRAIYSHYENAKVYVRIGDLHAKAGNYQESMRFYELAHNAYYVCYTYAELVHEKNSLVKSMLELSNKIVDNEIAIYHLEQPPIASDTQQENTQIRSAEYESQQANHNTELISSVELPFTKADAYASIELAIDRLLETVTSSSFTNLEISQAIKNLGTRLQDNYFLLNKQQKTVLYEKLNTMLEQHKVCFISKLSHGNYLVVEQLFNLISSLVTTKTLNADEIKITHYDTRKIISRSFSQRYFHLIRMHGKEDIKNQCIEIKSELEKLSTDKDKMAYINLMLKNHKEIAELLSNPRYSSETEQLFILSERINIICDTLNLPDDVTNPTSKYTESVTWYQWIRHVGLLTRVSTKSNEFFSIAPAIEEFGNFESVPVHMALNIENDANYQKSPPYAGFSLPIAGSKSDAGSRSENH